MKTHILGTALLVFASPEVLAATLSNGDVLTISTGQYVYDANGNHMDVISGSYYGADVNGSYTITGYEKTALAQGTTGIVIGSISTPGAYHDRSPTAGDTNAVTAPGYFFGNTESWYFSTPPGGNTATGFDMSGWSWAWDVYPYIDMSHRPWQPGNCADLGCTGYTFTEGVGRFQWDGVYGHTYSLDFTSTTPAGSVTGTGDLRYFFHFEGSVMAVPEPAPAWMFSSGLLVLIGAARRRKKPAPCREIS